MTDFVPEFLALLLRWLHVAAAAIWFGATVRFLLLADRLAAAGPNGTVLLSYGGFLYTLAPAAPDGWHRPLLPLRWSSYLTCLAGYALLVRVFYLEPGLWLVEAHGPWPAAWMAVAAAVAGLVLGYLVYELLCRVFAPLPGWMQGPVWGAAIVLTGLAWAAAYQIRAALVHTGVLIATCIAANVGHHVAPCEERLRRAAAAGTDPDPACLERARGRTLHNAYAMPVVLALMLVGHAPLVLPPRSLPLFLAGVVAAGFAGIDAVRHLRHRPRRGYAAAAVVVLGLGAALWASLPAPDPATEASPPPTVGQVGEVIGRRCLGCHAGSAPAGGLALDRPGVLAQNARAIALAAGFGRSMPPGNVTGTTEEERRLLRRWFEAGAPAGGER